jgi:hypothetical protein
VDTCTSCVRNLWIHSDNPMKSQAFAGSALVALGVATGSLLAPQAASALDFNFSFGGVTGLIQNLVDNQDNLCDGSDACVVSVSAGAPIGVYSVNGPGGGPSGFSVAGGLIDATNGLFFLSPDPSVVIEFEVFQGSGNGGLLTSCGDLNGCSLDYFGPVSFTPASPSSVPGPLPLFGVAAAFGFSRKLRNRIKCSANALSITPSA